MLFLSQGSRSRSLKETLNLRSAHADQTVDVNLKLLGGPHIVSADGAAYLIRYSILFANTYNVRVRRGATLCSRCGDVHRALKRSLNGARAAVHSSCYDLYSPYP